MPEIGALQIAPIYYFTPAPLTIRPYFQKSHVRYLRF